MDGAQRAVVPGKADSEALKAQGVGHRRNSGMEEEEKQALPARERFPVRTVRAPQGKGLAAAKRGGINVLPVDSCS